MYFEKTKAPSETMDRGGARNLFKKKTSNEVTKRFKNSFKT